MPYKPQRTLTLFPLVNFHMGLDHIILGLDSSEPHEEQIQVLRSCKLSHLVLILTGWPWYGRPHLICYVSL